MDRAAWIRNSALVLGTVAMACGGDNDQTCGVADAVASSTVMVSANGSSIAFGSFSSSPNNDCPGGGPDVSLTLEAGQSAGVGNITLCIPNPGAIGTSSDLSIHPGSEPEDRTEAVTIVAQDGDCTLAIDNNAAPAGTVTYRGICPSPDAPYEITFAAQVAGTRTCQGQSAQNVTLELTGSAVVTPQ